VVVGTEFSDDAAVVRLDGWGRGLVMTTDVIAPIVDDPEVFGEIAACNALSDVYAMGGRPLWALNLVFFPDDKLPLAVLKAVLAGGARACARAGVRVVGGHSVRDPEPKFGLAVTGGGRGGSRAQQSSRARRPGAGADEGAGDGDRRDGDQAGGRERDGDRGGGRGHDLSQRPGSRGGARGTGSRPAPM
jgi:selenide,water dikinase